MAVRIGGPVVSGFNPSGPTWASMRAPLVLNAFNWNASYTEFSRQWPLSEEEPPKFFKWNSGSLFRKDTFGTVPYFVISSSENPEDPSIVYTSFTVGILFSVFKTVDNHDFLQLVGEDIVTDIGTFTIEASAHTSGQTLSSSPPGGTEITEIGKLTGF